MAGRAAIGRNRTVNRQQSPFDSTSSTFIAEDTNPQEGAFTKRGSMNGLGIIKARSADFERSSARIIREHRDLCSSTRSWTKEQQERRAERATLAAE